MSNPFTGSTYQFNHYTGNHIADTFSGTLFNNLTGGHLNEYGEKLAGFYINKVAHEGGGYSRTDNYSNGTSTVTTYFNHPDFNEFKATFDSNGKMTKLE